MSRKTPLFCCLYVGWLNFVTADTSVGSDVVSNSNGTSHWYEDLFVTDKCCQTWILSILASCVVGLSGIVPLIFVPIGSGAKLNEQGGSKLLKLLLSFAVGGLLGDVFLHLLPEAWNHIDNRQKLLSSHLNLGLWVLLGMFSFVVIEIMFAASQGKKEVALATSNGFNPKLYTEKEANGVTHTCNGDPRFHETLSNPCQKLLQNGSQKHSSKEIKEPVKIVETIHITGYLNLMANSIDNFTHGLAVAGSFLVGTKMGILTTFAILIHEIPHEIGDFAILLKSGFNPWNAAKAQISTATIGILGAVVALSSDSADKLGSCTFWILPFTSGGFLNIALVNVLPDLLKEKDPWESMKQMLCLCGGIAVMALISVFIH